MSPATVSARFAAYVWYRECAGTKVTAREARAFARENWAAFLPSAHEGLGRLLLRVARAGGRGRARCRRIPAPVLA